MKVQFFRFLTMTAFAAVVASALAVAQNISSAEIEEWRAAAGRGDALAQLNLGRAYRDGKGVAEDTQEAVRWLRKAADQGLAEAQHNLGHAYWFGTGVAKDAHEAIQWYRKAADQGFVLAQYILGQVHYEGFGIAKNYPEAAHWYHKAADQGFAGAQEMLGVLYAGGLGVVKDEREAFRWFRMAAEQGHVGAADLLSVAYWNGDGVVTDVREAYVWYSIVAQYKYRRGILHNRNWHKYLSQSQIRSAKKEAERRTEEIKLRKAGQSEGEKTSASKGNFVLATEPKGETPAARVFANTWRSVVVVHNGRSQGSGVIVLPNVVATNCHVVDSRARIIVYKSVDRRADTGTDFSATIRHADKDKDFCLLDVENLWGVPAMVRKYDTLKVGENVYGLGAPQGLDLSLSEGLISQLRKTRNARFIQTDAAISPGSSGGGLFDRDGNLIGILTAKITERGTEGIGFAIPADLVLNQ